MKLSESTIWTPEERAIVEQDTMLTRHLLEEQYANLEQQHETATLGMWVFLATEVMFFGALFVGLGAYTYLHHEAFERASEKLNWIIGGLNTVLSVVYYLKVMKVMILETTLEEVEGRPSPPLVAPGASVLYASLSSGTAPTTTA